MLYKVFSGSHAYQHIGNQVFTDPTDHTLESKIKLYPVEADTWTIYTDYYTEVDVYYAIRSAQGCIFKRGTVKQSGHFSGGYTGLNQQEKMVFVVEPVLDALGKATIRIVDDILYDPSLIDQAHVSIFEHPVKLK